MPPRLPDELVNRFARDMAALQDGASGRIGLAVSGGPDSLGLLLLAAAAFPGEIEAATVDHRLRPEGAVEARSVALLCEQLGVPHATLAVAVDGTKASLQKQARDERYRALGAWLHRRSLAVLATAHHVDDQAETLMMRLMRGAGVAGLSGVRARARLSHPGGEALLVRPLLGWRRDELRAVVALAGVVPADDPSNQNPRFDRARIRRHLGESAWIDPRPLARSAAALAEANQALEWTAEQLAGERIRCASGTCSLAPEGLPRELQRRLLLHVLARMNPTASAAPRGDDVTRLLDRLGEGGTGTLAGVKCIGGPTWTFTTAPARRETR